MMWNDGNFMNKGENSQFMVLKVHLDTCIDKKKEFPHTYNKV